MRMRCINSRQSAGLQLKEKLRSHCESELLSVNGIRKIIRRHGRLTSKSNENNDNDDYEFFLEACDNERVTEGIIRCLLEHFPNAASANGKRNYWSPLHFACSNKNVTLNIIRLLLTAAAPDSVRSLAADQYGRVPLHYACGNPNVTLGIIQLLITEAPNSVWCRNYLDSMPLHILCENRQLGDEAAMEILRLLIEKYPEAVRHTDNDGNLPIHLAAGGAKSPEFCRLLIEAYPGSERTTTTTGALPLHWACAKGSLATVEYLYRLFPEAIARLAKGFYPCHVAIQYILERYHNDKEGPATAAEILKFLLDCDPNVKLQKYEGKSLLHYACGHETISVLFYACEQEFDDSNIEAALQIVKTIYGAHPEAIEDNVITSNIRRYDQRIQAFINNELVYVRQAKNIHIMTTHNDTLQLPLHTALQTNVTLGSIKLLVKGNRAALLSPDNSGALPLHIACEHHGSSNVVKYLIGLVTASLAVLDRERNAALHYACRGAKYRTIVLLLEEYNGMSVSKQNTQRKLPIELLWESDAVEDRESTEYVESVFQLLKAYPETLMNVCTEDDQPASAACSSRSGNGKKSCRNSLLVSIRKAMRSSRKRVQRKPASASDGLP